MLVKQTNTTEADRKSAEFFFEYLRSFHDLSTMSALDMFARNGQLTVANYSEEVKLLSLWELGPEHREELEGFQPDELNIGCSYKQMQINTVKHELLVIDSPQGIHKDADGNEHVEHFDVMRNVEKLITDHAIIVLYVNKSPYDKGVEGEHGYDAYEEYNFQRWMTKRMEFYRYDALALTEEIALRKYTEIMHSKGYKIVNVLIVPCFSDVPGKEPYAFRLGLEVQKVR